MPSHGQLNVPRSITDEEFSRAIDGLKTDILKGHFKEPEPGGSRRELTLTDDDSFIIQHIKLSDRSIIDIRHGHTCEFMWWLERLVWERLQSEFGGSLSDDERGSWALGGPVGSYADHFSAKGEATMAADLEYLNEFKILTPEQMADFGIDSKVTA